MFYVPLCNQNLLKMFYATIMGINRGEGSMEALDPLDHNMSFRGFDGPFIGLGLFSESLLFRNPPKIASPSWKIS